MNDEELNNETINELIKELADLNTKLNSKDKSNIQLVLKGIEDDRDLIIETILSDEDFLKFTKKQYKSMAYYYEKDIDDFRLIVIKILNALLKNYKLFAANINSPKGHLLSYCFKQRINNRFPNRIWSMFHRYYDNFEEMRGTRLLEPMFIHQTYCDDDLDFNYSNKYYVDYHESGINSMDDRSRIDDEDEGGASENILLDEELINEGGTDEEYQKWATNDVIIIRKYDIPYKKTREDNIELNDVEYSHLIDGKMANKLRRWHKYKDLTAVYPHDIFRYHPGLNKFKLREDSTSKKIEHIYAKCILNKRINHQNEDDLDYIKIQEYINKIIDALTEREKLLIRYLYYEMLPSNKVIDLMGYKNKKALNTEKSDCLGKIEKQLLKEYEYILEEYNGTRLLYWTKRIKQNCEYK